MMKVLPFLALVGVASAFTAADWTLVAEKKECKGRITGEMNAGRKMTLDECAHSCRGVSSMFTYGTNAFGKWFRTGLGSVWYCNDKNHRFPGCICNCVKSAVDGECPGGKTSVNHGLTLYKYESENIDWSLVAEKKECGGSETNMGWKRTVADCANACRGKASMFTYGTNDFGTNKCLLPCRGCKCFCETASSSGTCNEELNHDGFRLYKYETNEPVAPVPSTEAPKAPDQSKEVACPVRCTTCKTGGGGGGLPINSNGVCEHFCSKKGYCGNGKAYKTGDDCSGCRASDVLNEGKDCWRGCGRQQGPCDWCGSGVCCRKGWWDTRNGCDGTIGMAGKGHVCSEAPAPTTGEPEEVVLNYGRDCWRGCGRQQGECDWCGSGVCCRKGWWDTRNGCDGSIGIARKGHVCVEASDAPRNPPAIEQGLKNGGRNCWGHCGRKQGPCDWCGTGVCCRMNWRDKSNGCDGSIGRPWGHACVLPVPPPATQAPTTIEPTTEAPNEPDSPSQGLICRSDDECKTEAQMGAGWSSLFANQPTAPCLDMTSRGMNGIFCFTNNRGQMKPCSCWDSNEEFDNEWCNAGRFGADHTMCIYEEGAQSQCGEVRVAGITDQAMKDSIVSKHNELRSKVANGQEDRGVDGTQPKAANMMEIVWSDELALVAQRWVDQCDGAHDDNRKTDKYSSVGQNWAARFGGNHDDSSEQANLMIQSWYDEVADITLRAVNSYSSDRDVTGSTGVIGHYTQVVWARTAEVGCGYMTSLVNGRLESVLVCNYGPGGNWRGDPVYEQGDAGSNCPEGTTATSAGLCA